MAFKLGRNRPAPPARRPLMFGDYVQAAFTPPPTLLYGPKALPVLAEMLGNDTVGDCVEAAMLHATGVWEDNAGRPVAFTTAEAIALYSAITGYDPNDPTTDQGTDELTAFAYWKQTGVIGGKHKIAGWVSIDATNKTEVMTAIWLFENVCFGIELPDAYVTPFPSGNNFLWGVEGPPDPNNGHCFLGHGYGNVGVRIATWGMRGGMTWDAVAKYASTSGSGELYTVLSADSIATATAKAPNGFSFAQLQTDLQALSHGV